MLQQKRKVDKCFSLQLYALDFNITVFSSVTSRLQKGWPRELPVELSPSSQDYFCTSDNEKFHGNHLGNTNYLSLLKETHK